MNAILTSEMGATLAALFRCCMVTDLQKNTRLLLSFFFAGFKTAVKRPRNIAFSFWFIQISSDNEVGLYGDRS